MGSHRVGHDWRDLAAAVTLRLHMLVSVTRRTSGMLTARGDVRPHLLELYSLNNHTMKLVGWWSGPPYKRVKWNEDSTWLQIQASSSVSVLAPGRAVPFSGAWKFLLRPFLLPSHTAFPTQRRTDVMAWLRFVTCRGDRHSSRAPVPSESCLHHMQTFQS